MLAVMNSISLYTFRKCLVKMNADIVVGASQNPGCVGLTHTTDGPEFEPHGV